MAVGRFSGRCLGADARPCAARDGLSQAVGRPRQHAQAEGAIEAFKKSYVDIQVLTSPGCIFSVDFSRCSVILRTDWSYFVMLETEAWSAWMRDPVSCALMSGHLCGACRMAIMGVRTVSGTNLPGVLEAQFFPVLPDPHIFDRGLPHHVFSAAGRIQWTVSFNLPASGTSRDCLRNTPCRTITAFARHQSPGDACHLVCQRYASSRLRGLG